MSEPTKALYLLDGDSEPTRIRRKADGEIRMTVADEMPENFIDGTDAGLYVFDGTIHDVRGWTDEQCEAIGIPTSAAWYDEWWQGSLREATAAEILAVFAPKEATALTLTTQRAEAAEERLMKMTAVAELHAGDVDRLIAERDALRKVNDAMIERAYAVMHRCYGERVMFSKWDIRDALHAALARGASK